MIIDEFPIQKTVNESIKRSSLNKSASWCTQLIGQVEQSTSSHVSKVNHLHFHILSFSVNFILHCMLIKLKLPFLICKNSFVVIRIVNSLLDELQENVNRWSPGGGKQMRIISIKMIRDHVQMQSSTKICGTIEVNKISTNW